VQCVIRAFYSRWERGEAKRERKAGNIPKSGNGEGKGEATKPSSALYVVLLRT
jgi:hypothetical protein